MFLLKMGKILPDKLKLTHEILRLVKLLMRDHFCWNENEKI